MKATSGPNVASNEGRLNVFFRVLTSTTLGLTVGLGVVCSLIWADQGIRHAQLVDRETLISLTGYTIFLVVVHAMGVLVTPLRSMLPAFTFAISLVISFAVDIATASIATRRYLELWSDGPNNETVHGSWVKLSLPQRDALQVDLNCCGFAEPADDLFETAVCYPDAELPGCHLPWKDFLSYQSIGVTTAFFTMAAMHALLLVFIAGIIDRGIREGTKCYNGSAGSLAGNVGSLTAGCGKDQPSDRDVPSRLPSVSRRPLTGEVALAAEGGRSHRITYNCAVCPSPAVRPFFSAHAKRTLVTFDPSSMKCATNSPTSSQPVVSSHSSTANPRDSHGSTLSADSVLGAPPCCHCTGSNELWHRLDSGTNNHRPHCAEGTRAQSCRPDPSWEPAEARGIVRLSGVTASTPSTSKVDFPAYSWPSPSNSPSSSTTPSYHTAGEDSGAESRVGEKWPNQFDVLKWGVEIERFITGTGETGAKRLSNIRAGDKRSL